MKKYKVFFTNGNHIEFYAEGFEVDVHRETIRFEGVALFNFQNIAGFIETEDLNTLRGEQI